MYVDAHTHFYDPYRPGGVPFPKKDDALLYRRVLPEHFLEVAMPCNVSRTIVIEASRWKDDNLWVLDLAAANDCIVGFIAGVDPRDPHAREQILKLSKYPVFRGIRLRPEDLKDLTPTAWDNLELLQELGLSVDLMANTDDLEVILKIADRCPGLPLIIDHIADIRIDGKPLEGPACARLNELGAKANIYCKVSAIQEHCEDLSGRTELDYFRPVLDQLYRSFTGARLIYGSNWPVCERAGAYAEPFNLVTNYFAEKGPAAVEKVMLENSKKCYGWDG